MNTKSGSISRYATIAPIILVILVARCAMETSAAAKATKANEEADLGTSQKDKKEYMQRYLHQSPTRT